MTQESPETRYARSGEASIAYQTVGDGERDLVIVPPFVSHVELAWEHPPYGDFMRTRSMPPEHEPSARYIGFGA
jgi:hypothetical protein